MADQLDNNAMRFSPTLVAEGAVVFTVGFTITLLTSSAYLSHFGGDNAVYLLTAAAWSPYSLASDFAQHFADTSRYPPAFPFVLAVFGGGESIHLAHRICGVLFSFALGLLWLLLRSYDVDRESRLVLVAAFAFNHTSIHELLSVHSEHLYLPVSIACLYFAKRVVQNNQLNDAICLSVALLCLLATRSMVSERVRSLAPMKTVSSLMTSEVAFCDPSDTIDELMEIMTARRFRHLPVMSNNRLVGMISIGDVVKHRIGEIQGEAEAMRAYIANG